MFNLSTISGGTVAEGGERDRKMRGSDRETKVGAQSAPPRGVPLSIRRILVPVDFSASSHEAMRFAGELAKRFGAHITLIHVYQVPGYALPEGFLVAGPQTVITMTAEIEHALTEARTELAASGVGEVDALLVQGAAHVEILHVAKKGRFDLIVMGTHGRTGLSRALIGSVAEKVVRKSSCPVLTIHAPPPEEREEHVAP
jgi:nucleotide-binding universal stress UspA family protein